ncbi:MAG: FHA domain-containing protein [Armatimonadota bacterium]|nr:FHA domain-containing protein [Armatimonadota bacterium]
MKNYYAILEVPVGSSREDILQAYRRLAQENLDNDAVFTELKEAYDVLTTPDRRAEYDQATWGETFASGSAAETAPMSEDQMPITRLMSSTQMPVTLPVPISSAAPAHANRCPMGAEGQCPVLQGRVAPGDKFCPECGYLLANLDDSGFDALDQSDPSGEIRLEEPGGRTHRLRPGISIVGRENADILLPDKTVSRQHARLEVGEDGTVTVEDLSSTNGTQVSGERLLPHVPRRVNADDRVRFGSVATELRLPASKMPATEASARPSLTETGQAKLPEGEVRAQVVDMREEGARTYPLLPGLTTFGRRADNSVILPNDPYVSGSHAQIHSEDGLFRVTDTGSTNGTLLNGQRLAPNEPVVLTPGDVILIGGSALRFEILDAEPSDIFVEDVPEDAPTMQTVETQTVETEPEAAPASEEAPAEPRERTAQEYDVPAESAPAHDAPIHAEG